MKATWPIWGRIRRAIGQDKLRQALGDLFSKSGLPGELFVSLAFIAILYIFIAFTTEQGFLEDWVQREANEMSGGPTGSDVVVVLIDDRARREFGPGVDSRAMINCIQERVAAAQPRVIGLDYVFGAHSVLPDPDIEALPCPGAGSRLSTAHSVPVVVASTKASRGGYLEETPPSKSFIEFEHVLYGYGEVIQDRQDGVVRSVRLWEDIQARMEAPAASLALTIWLAAQTQFDIANSNEPTFDLRNELARCRETRLPDAWCHRLPDDPWQRIRFFNPIEALNLVSVSELFADECRNPQDPACKLSALKDKIVLIGSSHSEIQDKYQTPLGSDIPFASLFFSVQAENQVLAGVVVHGLILQNLLDERGFIKVAPRPLTVTLMLAGLFLPALLVASPLLSKTFSRTRFARLAGLLTCLAVLVVAGVGLFMWSAERLARSHEMLGLTLISVSMFGGAFLALLMHFLLGRLRNLNQEEFLRRHAGQLGERYRNIYERFLDALDVDGAVTAQGACLDIVLSLPKGSPDTALEIGRLQQEMLSESGLEEVLKDGLAIPMMVNFVGDRCSLISVLTNEKENTDGSEDDQGLATSVKVLSRLATRIMLTSAYRYKSLGRLEAHLKVGDITIYNLPADLERGIYSFGGSVMRRKPFQDGQRLECPYRFRKSVMEVVNEHREIGGGQIDISVDFGFVSVDPA